MCNRSPAVFAYCQMIPGRGKHAVFPSVDVPDRPELKFPLRYPKIPTLELFNASCGCALLNWLCIMSPFFSLACLFHTLLCSKI